MHEILSWAIWISNNESWLSQKKVIAGYENCIRIEGIYDMDHGHYRLGYTGHVLGLH